MQVTCSLWELLPTKVNEVLDEYASAAGVSKLQALVVLCSNAVDNVQYSIQPVGQPVVVPRKEVVPEEVEEELEPEPELELELELEEPEPEPEPVKSLPTVKELREELAERGLPVDGTREELAERVANHDENPDRFAGFDFEGRVGTRLKNLLEKNFASTQELLAVPLEEVGKLPGLGGKCFELLVSNLTRLGLVPSEEPEKEAQERPDDLLEGFYLSLDDDFTTYEKKHVTQACVYFQEVMGIERAEARERIAEIIDGVYDASDPSTYETAIEEILWSLPMDGEREGLVLIAAEDFGIGRPGANDKSVILFGRGLSEITIGEAIRLVDEIENDSGLIQVDEQFVF